MGIWKISTIFEKISSCDTEYSKIRKKISSCDTEYSKIRKNISSCDTEYSKIRKNITLSSCHFIYNLLYEPHWTLLSPVSWEVDIYHLI
jgi:hypothetical protein